MTADVSFARKVIALRDVANTQGVYDLLDPAYDAGTLSDDRHQEMLDSISAAFKAATENLPIDPPDFAERDRRIQERLASEQGLVDIIAAHHNGDIDGSLKAAFDKGSKTLPRLIRAVFRGNEADQAFALLGHNPS